MYAPSNATVDAKLPLFFVIQDGGFNSLSNANYNGFGLIKASGNDIVAVNFNCRVGLFRLLTGQGIESTPDASSHNSLRA